MTYGRHLIAKKRLHNYARSLVRLQMKVSVRLARDRENSAADHTTGCNRMSSWKDIMHEVIRAETAARFAQCLIVYEIVSLLESDLESCCTKTPHHLMQSHLEAADSSRPCAPTR